ncbi:MAG: hypothetical protein R3E42_17665 [Burkholderiaceae bacterium]
MVRQIALFNGVTNECSVRFAGALQGENEREGDFALTQVIAQVLPNSSVSVFVVQYVVNNLEGRSECFAHRRRRPPQFARPHLPEWALSGALASKS